MFVSCAYLAIITRAWIREYNDVKPQRAKVKGHGQGTRYSTVRAGTAQWVSKLRWGAGSLSVDETGKKMIFMAVSRFKLVFHARAGAAHLLGGQSASVPQDRTTSSAAPTNRPQLLEG